MSRDGSVTFDWGDDTHTFRLGWGELEMLQEATDAGPWVVLRRLGARTCLVGDISHVVRCGLIGGGKKPEEAVKLVRTYVEKRPPAENVVHAFNILAAALHGAEDEEPGEPEAASETAENA